MFYGWRIKRGIRGLSEPSSGLFLTQQSCECFTAGASEGLSELSSEWLTVRASEGLAEVMFAVAK